MPARRKPTAAAELTAAETRARTAEHTLRAILTERAIKALESRIDTKDPNNARRREAKVELKPEDQRLTARDRLKGASVGRNLHRHNSRYRTFENAWSVNVVGTGPKLTVHWDDKGAAQTVADWFNQKWASDCDARDDNHLADFADIALLTVAREGECLCVFDDFDAGDGRLTWYEADQLPTIEPKQWEAFALDPANGGLYTQPGPGGKPVPLNLAPGRLTDRAGRVMFYIADELHGRSDLDPADESLRYLSTNVARLLKAPWRFNQLVGQPEVLALAGDLEDLDAMRAAEIASARKNSERAYAVKGRDAYEQELARAGIDADDLIENAESDPAAGKVASELNLTRLERYADGYVDYIGTDEEIVELGANRPNVQTANFHGQVGGQAGASLGLAKVYATLEASTSYTAFRGEMLLSWGGFARRQKWLERRFLDWVAIKAIGWAVATGKIRVVLPQDWQYSLSWSMPTMPEVDELKSVTARAKRLKNGLTTYATELGPSAMAILASLADELTYIRGALPELEILETKAGAPSTPADTGGDDE